MPELCPYMVVSWICVLWLGAVRHTYTVKSALLDKGMEKLFKPLATFANPHSLVVWDVVTYLILCIKCDVVVETSYICLVENCDWIINTFTM
jgi:hypothetical protein